MIFEIGELVEVESADDGFEGCWCEAIVTKYLRSKTSATADCGANMYEVRYTRFVGARGKPIAETVCEQRVRPDVPAVVGYSVKAGDFVDALWWDGWWHGHVVQVDESGTSPIAHVKFPAANGQLLRLKASDVRAHLRYEADTRSWMRKMPAEGSAHAGQWVRLDPSMLTPRSPAAASKRQRSSVLEGASGPDTEGHTKYPRVREPLPDLPPCPTFYPTSEEWADPHEYIASIREQAEAFGLCKVVPPSNWKPSWPIDSENFKFNTRIQNVHQLQERGEFIFWKQLKESLQRHGNPVKMLPRLDGKQLDMFALYRKVVRLGGHRKVSAEQKWSEVADELKVSKRLETRDQLVQSLYQEYLQVYEEEQGEQMTDAIPGPAGRVARSIALTNVEEEVNVSGNPSPLKNVASMKSPEGAVLVTGLDSDDEDQLDQKCEICNSDNDPSSILLCDSCDGGYHTYCLRPKVRNVPKGEWHCPRCRKTAQVALDEPFGFKDGPRYSLPTFHTLAQSYKSRWFNGAKTKVHDIEQDFWDIVEGGSLNHDVQVLYGNDLPTLTYGSGFSTDASDAYSKHPWNLNVMPTLPGSLLRHLEEVKKGQRLSGIVAPWIYFGMLFSSFCWHNEDNYLYSINYMHWGEGKVWYSVPGYAAEQLEEAMRASMPELFASSPDLLFHITTMLSPRVLVDAKVPCYKLVQEHGNFVITFPKAYHGGFSLGFNCGEAVNFAIADWLPWGQDAITKYRSFRHLAAFSVQKLLCSIAEAPLEQLLVDGTRSLDLVTAAMDKEVKEETQLRDSICKAGVTMMLRMDQAPVVAREDGDEDGRLCAACKQNCYFSFVSCPCDMTRNVCLHHHAQLCNCHPERQVLFFRHTLDELGVLQQRCIDAAATSRSRAHIAASR